MNTSQPPRTFSWENLGDLQLGRPNLGPMAPVLAYRLMQFTLWDVLIGEFGPDKANDLFRRAGNLAGKEFCRNLLDKSLPFSAFVAQLQKVLKQQLIGLMRMERVNLETMQFTLTVAEDLDCSGLPCTDEIVCQYDEGFIAGILEEYTGKVFDVTETDCWASGARVCRFSAKLSGDAPHD
ncbi:V4R domain-containing protein [Desulfobulbus sp.]|uniref:V4R domain-containing protein n=1 Tax=Desulfobulbus sp. TaxID=895 RepID=UPI00286F5AD4|nr:V4R domain-containing protein [Desulfobulbus sp.]